MSDKDRYADVECAGCGKHGREFLDEERLAIGEDRSYDKQLNKFVCMSCYCRLILIGQDIGDARILISNAINYLKRRKK